MKVSQKLKLEVLKRRAAGTKQYEIAKAAEVHPTTFASLLHDALPIDADDKRVLRIAALLRVAAKDAFEPDAPATSRRAR